MHIHILWVILSAGILVPILPRIVVPLLREDRYRDTFHAVFLVDPIAGLGVLLWTSLPFIGLAFYIWLQLRKDNFSVKQRKGLLIRILGTLLPTFGLGCWIHLPQTVSGVNFGLVTFPVYAGILMPFFYLMFGDVADKILGKD